MWQVRRLAAIGWILGALILLGAWPAGAAPYNTTQISTLGGAYLGLFPKINGKGEVAWAGNYYDSPGLYLYSGGKVKQLTNNHDIENFDINDLGQVVWSMSTSSGYDIFLYKNGGTTPITTNGNNNFDPSFNANGDFVWHSYNGLHAYVNQCTSAGAVSTIWTCTSYSDWNANANFINPVINNLRQVAWIIITQDASYNLLDNIYLLSGGTAAIVHTSPSFTPDLGYTDPLHSLNNHGDLVFSASDGIWLKKSGAAVQKIATTANRSYRPRINDHGLVAYVGDSTANYTAVFLYTSAGGSQKLTDNGTYPFLNNKDQVIWTNYQGIYLYNQNSAGRIVNYGYPVYPTLNDRGQVAWQGEFSGDGIFLSRPATGLAGAALLLLQ